MIALWELCALVGLVTQVVWNYDIISRKQSKLQKNLWQQSMGLGLFTFTCLPLQRCHWVPLSYWISYVVPQIYLRLVDFQYFLQNPEREVIIKKTNQMTTQFQWCHLHVVHAMDWAICIGEMLCCPYNMIIT
jgi:hypothetical protein